MTSKIYDALETHPDYQKLITERKKIIWPLAVLMVFVYFTYVLIIAFKPELFAIQIGGGHMTLGILSGLGIIFFTFILTGIYVSKANKILEPLVHKVQDAVQEE